MKKAQSAMEYLMTYGWAILIVIIVAAALFALGVFNPSTYTGRAATGFGELGAPSDWQYSATTLTLVLRNQAGVAVSVSNVSTAQGCYYDTAAIPIAAGGTGTATITGCTNKATGASFSETITVTYTASGSSLARTATGTVTGSAV